MKKCSKCKFCKSFDDFYKRKSTKDGLDYWCKLCAKKAVYSSPNLTKNCNRYRKKYKDKFNAYISNYYQQKRKNDIQFKIKERLRNRVNKALKGDFKCGSVVRDLGCSVEQFKIYLELKFHQGMTWENYGKGFGKWNIDHIKPLSSFNLTNREHFLQACHYTNLQPLWFEENLKKSNIY